MFDSVVCVQACLNALAFTPRDNAWTGPTCLRKLRQMMRPSPCFVHSLPQAGSRGYKVRVEDCFVALPCLFVWHDGAFCNTVSAEKVKEVTELLHALWPLILRKKTNPSSIRGWFIFLVDTAGFLA